ncbi:MAG TPA: hypothetical protein VML19_13090 [Verrucomicrobiae bacterium]|nr:hypothetical protein [Verrucomicrobiae bacterium]
MKRATTTLMAAAAFVVAAGIASAQTLEANIPFAFHANGRTLEAGTYRVGVQRSNSGNSMMVISGRHGERDLLTFLYASDEGKPKWAGGDNAVLSFRCAAGSCALANIWLGTGDNLVYRVPTPTIRKDATVTTAEVVLHPVKASAD